MITKEPGGTPIGRQIRRICLDPRNRNLKPMAELFLMLADRNQHIAELIRPYLNKNFIVLSDRYSDSSIAYQAAGRNMNISMVTQLNNLATDHLEPDLTFLLESNLKTSVKKAKLLSKEYKGGDRIEKETLAFHNKVKKEYRTLCRKNNARIKRIELRDSLNATQDLLQAITRSKLKQHKIL